MGCLEAPLKATIHQIPTQMLEERYSAALHNRKIDSLKKFHLEAKESERCLIVTRVNAARKANMNFKILSLKRRYVGDKNQGSPMAEIGRRAHKFLS